MGSVDSIGVLLAAGVPVGIRDGNGATPLHYAAFGDNRAADAIRFLLDHGADIEAVEDAGHTALFYAAQSGKKDLVRLLIDRGASVNGKGKDVCPPMFGAAFSKDGPRVLQLLADKGADLKASGARKRDGC
jgi:ankyrin repeat protein